MGKGAAGGMTGVGRGVTIPVSPPPVRPMVTSGGVGVLPPSGMTPLQGAPGPVVGPVSPPPMNATGTANMGLGASAQTTIPPIQPDFTEMMGPGIWDIMAQSQSGLGGLDPSKELGNPNIIAPFGPNLPQRFPAPARGVGPKVRDFGAPDAMPPMPAPNPMPQSDAPRHTGSGGMPMPNPMRQQMKARSTNMLEPPSMPIPNPERGDFRALMDAGEGSPPPVSAPEVPQPVMGSTPIQGMFEPKGPPPIQPSRPTPLSEVPFSGRPVNEVGPNRLTPPVPAGPPGQAQPVSAPPQRPPVQNAALPVNEPLTQLSPAPIQTQRTPADIHALKAGKPADTSGYYGRMYNAVYDAAVKAGAPNPEALAALGAAQTALETGYGKHMVGNNAFGIKGSGPGSVKAKTWEVRGGKNTTETASFRGYGSPEESAADWVNLMMSKSRYSDVWNAPNLLDAITAQSKSGYATDPNYGSKLKNIARRAGYL